MKKLVFLVIVLCVIVLPKCEEEKEYEQIAQMELEVNNFFDANSGIYSEEIRENILDVLNDSTMEVEDRLDLANEWLDGYKKRIKE